MARPKNTPEQNAAARAKRRNMQTNISVSKESRDSLNDLRDRLSADFGFEMTVTQTLTWLLGKASITKGFDDD